MDQVQDMEGVIVVGSQGRIAVVGEEAYCLWLRCLEQKLNASGPANPHGI